MNLLVLLVLLISYCQSIQALRCYTCSAYTTNITQGKDEMNICKGSSLLTEENCKPNSVCFSGTFRFSAGGVSVVSATKKCLPDEPGNECHILIASMQAELAMTDPQKTVTPLHCSTCTSELCNNAIQKFAPSSLGLVFLAIAAFYLF